jgi:hypothetical protein
MLRQALLSLLKGNTQSQRRLLNHSRHSIRRAVAARIERVFELL